MPRRNVSRGPIDARLAAFDAGRQAAMDGVGRDANPYPPDSRLAAAWRRGWGWQAVLDAAAPVVRHV